MPRTRSDLLISATIALALGAAGAPPPLRAADLVEPWAPGVSNAEIFYATGDRSAGRSLSGLVGLGLGGGSGPGGALSLGVSFASTREEASAAGLVLVYSRGLGPWGELDLWGELQLPGATFESELGSSERSFGIEWSREVRRVVPYVRLSAARCEGETAIHPLVGLLLPIGRRLGLHLEISGEEPEAGPWPVHVALGPNWQATRWLELIPELALLEDRSPGGDTSVVFTLGAALDLSVWRMRIDG